MRIRLAFVAWLVSAAAVIATEPVFTETGNEFRFDNHSAQQAGDDVLTAVLGREACARRSCLTMDELIKENKKLEFDKTG